MPPKHNYPADYTHGMEEAGYEIITPLPFDILIIIKLQNGY